MKHIILVYHSKELNKNIISDEFQNAVIKGDFSGINIIGKFDKGELYIALKDNYTAERNFDTIEIKRIKNNG